MLALVKARPEAGLELRDVPVPEIGINDVLIRVHKTGICGTDLHIESWDPWAAATIKPPLVVGHEFVGEVVDMGSNVADLHPGRHRQRRGARRVRPLPALPGRPLSPLRQHAWPRRQPGRRVCRVRCPAGDERLAPLAGHRPGRHGDLRSVWERGPHGAGLSGPGRGRARRRRRADRAHGDRGGPPCRRSLRRRERAERVSPGARGPDGSDARHRPTRAETLADVQAELEMVEGFDVVLEMSGNAGALRDALSNMAHGGAMAILGIPTAEIPIDVNQIVFKKLTFAGHLRPGDVRDLVQDVGHAHVGAGHQPGDHPPVRLPRLRRGVRRRPGRRLRQGHHGLDVMSQLPDPLAFLADEVAALRERHLYRPLRVMSSAQGPIVSIDDRAPDQPVVQRLPRPDPPSARLPTPPSRPSASSAPAAARSARSPAR